MDKMLNGATQRFDQDIRNVNDAINGLRLEINTLNTGVALLKWLVPAAIAAAPIFSTIAAKLI